MLSQVTVIVYRLQFQSDGYMHEFFRNQHQQEGKVDLFEVKYFSIWHQSAERFHYILFTAFSTFIVMMKL